MMRFSADGIDYLMIQRVDAFTVLAVREFDGLPSVVYLVSYPA